MPRFRFKTPVFSRLCGFCQLFPLDQGYRVCYFFVSFNPNVKAVKLNNKIADYTKVFKECISKGMKSYGLTIKLQNTTPMLCSQIPTEFE